MSNQDPFRRVPVLWIPILSSLNRALRETKPMVSQPMSSMRSEVEAVSRTMGTLTKILIKTSGGGIMVKFVDWLS